MINELISFIFIPFLWLFTYACSGLLLLRDDEKAFNAQVIMLFVSSLPTFVLMLIVISSLASLV